MEKDEKRLTEHFRMDEFVYSAMAVELIMRCLRR